MSGPVFPNLPPPISEALSQRGFTALTPVQLRVSDPALVGHDLRIASKTGSGKTVAIGLVLARELAEASPEKPENGNAACPFALVIAPTRELAAQLHRELEWLFLPQHVDVAVVAGGASYRDELRALRHSPQIIVGTPGRLRDHLGRGSIDSSKVGAVVLDEADQMLDLGFREELEEILGATPESRRTHMASATFPKAVLTLAHKFQKNAKLVEGTQLGEANSDITHIVHFVRAEHKVDAIINLLLMAPDDRSLLFVRTRVGASELASQLESLGFRTAALSGDLEQRERNRTLESFRSGAIRILVATDVAARGLDIPEVGQVIHVDLPDDGDALIHRSGRTGRAGLKGTSILLAAPSARERLRTIVRQARVDPELRDLPAPEDVWSAADERLLSDEAWAQEAEPRFSELAGRLLAQHDHQAVVAQLLARLGHAGPCAPREVRSVEVRNERKREGDYVRFAVNWGGRDGADARRVLAMLCRRGGIEGHQVGAIRIGENDSTFEIHDQAVQRFKSAIARPDPKERWLRFAALRSHATPHRKHREPKAARRDGWDPPKRMPRSEW
ncbi:MAG: DEAD/DEAH box helicase [Deltaproteobacteria bacterium]|nr:DEAD/DEAH box helicase [Deltaproteobacteria bacterium]